MMRTLKIGSLLLMLCAATAHAQLYKWVGPDGKVTYSDTPPPKSASKVETKALDIGDAGAGAGDLPFEVMEAVKNHPVTLYTTRNCPPCEEGRKLLSGRGIPFKEKTVNNSEDAAQFREAGGDSNLPLLLVGRNKERGYEPNTWNRTLTAAGYPDSNKLPKTYRNPAAEAAAPASKSDASAKQEAAKRAQEKSSSTELPPAVGNAPPGFRF